MTERIQRFFKEQRPQTPCVVVDLEVIQQNYRSLREHLPLAEVYYAVKANPAPEVLSLLLREGSSFDAASAQEIEMCLACGIKAEQISFGNTIKKECDIAEAFQKGIQLYAFDCEEELRKIARSAPGSRVFCRILVENGGAQWPLSRKFGCEIDMAVDLLVLAQRLGLEAYGVSFHVGSQQTQLDQWDIAMARVAMLFTDLQQHGIELQAVNLGGGFPIQYIEDVANLSDFSNAVMRAVTDHFGNRLPSLMLEPGRSLVGDAGIMQAEVVLVSTKSYHDEKRWVYLDAGRFNGLIETLDEAIKYPMTTEKDHDEKVPVVLAGPTCDSMDVMYEDTVYHLPRSLKAGDKVQIHATGAYTTTYASVAFNGFEPIRQYCI